MINLYIHQNLSYRCLSNVDACWCVTIRTSCMPVGVLRSERRVCLLVCYDPNVVYACWCVTIRTSCMPVGVLQPERRVCMLVCYNPNVVDACWCVTTRTSWMHVNVLQSNRSECLFVDEYWYVALHIPCTNKTT
jgi:uncharacterized membrane protein YqaE (UPF0057 family)